MGARKRIPAYGLVSLLLSALVLPTPAICQDLSVGFRAGPCASAIIWRNPDALNSTQPRLGMHVGFLASLDFWRRGIAQTEFRYVRKGFRNRGGHVGGLSLDYVEIPVKVGIRVGGGTSFHVLTGPFVGLLVRCRVTDVALLETMYCDDPLAGMDRKSLDAGVSLGFGVERGFGGRRISLDLETAMSLTDSTVGSLPPGWAKNLSVHVIMGVVWPLNRREEVGR